MGFLKKAFDFVSRPTQSRTMGLVVMLILVTAVSLTVYVAQQQQEIRQRAAVDDACSPPYAGYLGCLSMDLCYDNLGNACIGSCPQTGGTDCNCYQDTKVGKACSTSSIVSGACDQYGECVASVAPIPTPACGKKGESSCENYSCDPGLSYDSHSGTCQASTPTSPSASTATPISSPAPDTRCNVILNGTEYFCATTSACPSGSTPSPDRRCYNQVCCARPVSTSTAAPAPIPATTNCPTNGDGRCGAGRPPSPNCTGLYYSAATPISNCTKELPNCWFCPQPTPTPTPSSECRPENCTTCGVGSVCAQIGVGDKKCGCREISSLTPTQPPPPTPTTPPLTINLAMAINAQDTPLTQDSISISLSLYNLTTNTPVSGAPATQNFARTPIPQRQYAANIPLTNLAINKYFIVARRDNMIAKSVFTVTSTSTTITVPTTTLVFGDINSDNDINALDYQLLRPCYKKTKVASSACASSDFDKNELIDQVDLNTLLRGWATWNKEGKEL